MNEKDEESLFPLHLPDMSYMMARHVLTGYVGEHHLNPRLHQSHDMGCSDMGHQVTLVKADEVQHRSHRETLMIRDPPPPPPPPPTSPSQLCKALGTMRSSHAAA